MMYAVLGMSIMVSANNLLAVYIGIEMQSLALYVMAAWNRDSLRASEAGLKYFVLGALSSGLLLYGISMVYGFTGSLSFDRIAEVVGEGATPGLIAGMVFMLCGLGFKISAAPFHMWTPDVYEGSPTPVTGFFAGAGGVVGVLTFMSIYVITTIGVFACILQMRIRNGMVEQITDLAGLSKTNSGLAVILTILMMWGDASVNDFVEAPSSLRWMTSFVALLILPLMILPFTAGPARNLIAQAANSLF